MILQKIVERKRERLEEAKRLMPIGDVKSAVKDLGPCRDFREAIEREGLSLIAEIKRASPSKGIIREDFNPADIALAYERCRVDAVSVITEEDFFLGRGEYLGIVKGIVSVPVLRKDFIIDSYQIYRSRAMGADAILLIASLLSELQLQEFYQTANEIGLACLVETHSTEDVEKAVKSGANIIGINNRDLSTFKTDISRTKELIGIIPRDRAVVSESGISGKEDAARIKSMGACAVLVGESIMRAGSIEEQIRQIKSV